MAPRPPIPGMARFLVQQTDGERALENVLRVQLGAIGLGSDWTPTQLSTMSQDIFTAWSSDILVEQGSQIHLTGVVAISEDGLESMGSYTPGSAPAGGQSGGSGMTAQVAACVSWPVPLAYRGGHFRTYIDGMRSVFMTDSQTMSAGVAMAFANGAASLQSTINGTLIDGNSCTLVGVSLRRGGAPRPSPLVIQLGTPNVDVRWASQRRRLGKLAGHARET